MYIDNVKTLPANSFYDRELYDEILAIPDDMTRQLKINEVSAKAKEFGLKSMFESSIKSMDRDLKRQMKNEMVKTDDQIGNKTTNFEVDGVVVDMNCGCWIANDDEGIKIYTDRGFVCACPHPIYVSKILKNAETGEYKAELIYKLRGRVNRILVPREMIASSRKIVQLANYGIQVTDGSARFLVKYLSDLEAFNNITEGISTSRLGWFIGTDEKGNNKRQFLPYQKEKITFDNEAFMKSLYESIKPHGDRDKWFDLVREIRAKRQPEVLINLSASFASVLVEICTALPFIVSLWGGTGIGKTVILKLVTSIWADPGEGKYITDSKATYTAMEMRLNVLNSLPMTLDDMAQVKNQYDGDFSGLIYRWCSGKGKDRSNKELGLNKLTNWRNCTITNGERSLVDESTQAGAVNRVLDIEASGTVLFSAKEGNKVSKTVEKTYGHAGQEFIDMITGMKEEEIQTICNNYYEQIMKIASDQGVEKEDKQIVPMALILTADYLSEKLFDDGVYIDINQAVNYLRNKGDVSEELRAYEYLMDVIASNQFRFENDSEVKTEQWGIFKEDNKVAIIGTVFERIMKQGGFQGKSFLSWAKRMDLIECDSKGIPKKPILFYGKTARAVVIKQGFNQDEPEDVDPIIKNLPFT